MPTRSADLNIGNHRANPLDHTKAFVSRYERPIWLYRPIAMGGMYIAVENAAGIDLNNNIQACSQPGFWNFLDIKGLLKPFDNDCLHSVSLSNRAKSKIAANAPLQREACGQLKTPEKSPSERFRIEIGIEWPSN
jgi:hypothetical protein